MIITILSWKKVHQTEHNLLNHIGNRSHYASNYQTEVLNIIIIIINILQLS